MLNAMSLGPEAHAPAAHQTLQLQKTRGLESQLSSKRNWEGDTGFGGCSEAKPEEGERGMEQGERACCTHLLL